MAEKATALKDLFEKIARGEKKAFDRLFLGHYSPLQKFAFLYVKQEEYAEEIISELFVRLWLRRNDLHQVAEPNVYLYKSVKNACLNHLRKTGNRAFVYLDEPGAGKTDLSDQGNPETFLEAKQLKDYLDRAVDALPEQRRHIFRMVKEDGLKCREVAVLLDLSVRTVENQVYKAVRMLADQVNAYFNNHSGSKNTLNNKGLFLLLLTGISSFLIFCVH